ncbi:MAG: hypothetical protein J6T12_08365 [Salinivirgaceae bacterium]|nr:hypothetical protein [Salinivirgaceae bacterium]
MNANLFKTTVAALALMATFNSCKKDDDKPSFPTEDIKLQIEDGKVITKQDSLRDKYFYSGEKEGYSDYITVGTTPDNLGSISLSDVEPFTKYYWCVRVRDRKNPNPNDYIQSEIRTFYYVIAPQITKIHNVEGDWAAIVKWEQSDYMKAAKLTLTPDKECKYDNTPIDLSAMTDSCYISAGGEFDSKYAVYHQWWDDSKAQYYEPVVYGFNVIYEGEIDGHSFSATSDTAKYIFLDRAKYAADNYFNVYRMGQFGNRTWLLEDLRGIPDGFTTIPILTSPLGFKACAYSSSFYNKNERFGIIPEGFHLATDDDWQDLEYTYGVEKKDYNNYRKIGKDGVLTGHLINYSPEWEWESLRKNYESLANDTIMFVGGKNDILSKLISDGEWRSNDSLDVILQGQDGFNARPYGLGGDNGRIGHVAAFLTKTKDSQNDIIIRFLWSANHGIGRISLAEYWDNCYLYRCVKDE